MSNIRRVKILHTLATGTTCVCVRIRACRSMRLLKLKGTSSVLVLAGLTNNVIVDGK
ncbi:hypothetical protein ACE6H2_026207 [Prunus campanulata]